MLVNNEFDVIQRGKIIFLHFRFMKIFIKLHSKAAAILLGRKNSYAHPQSTTVSLTQAPGHRTIRSDRPSDKILMTETLGLEDVPVSSDKTFDRAKYVPSCRKPPTDDCARINSNANNSIGNLSKKLFISTLFKFM